MAAPQYDLRSRLGPALLAAATLGAAAFGCTKHQTEAVVVVTTAGVRVPTDVHKVHFTVQDRSPAGDDLVFDQDVNLCHESLTTGCIEIPISAVLFPGKTRGGDSVRIQIDAIGGNEMPVISNAALFTFAEEQSLRLDFVLYANCIGNVECAKRDQACGPNDTCIDINPVTLHGPPDLAKPAPFVDMAMPADMTMVDLAGADLTMTPADLTSTLDMAGCTTVTCPPMNVCNAGQCQHCGDPGELCCQGPIMMRPPWPNGTPSPGMGMCNATNLVCDGTHCVMCGTTGALCCSGGVCFTGGDVCDGTGHCISTGGGGTGGGGGGLPGDMF